MSSASKNEPSAEDQESRLAAGRWRTSARIDAINRQHEQENQQHASATARYLSLVRVRLSAEELIPQHEVTPVTASDNDDAVDLASKDRVPAWLVSLLVHLALVLALALWVPAIPRSNGRSVLTINNHPAADSEPLATGEQQITPTLDLESQTAEVTEPAFQATDDVSLTKSLLEVPSPWDQTNQNNALNMTPSLAEHGAQMALAARLGGGKLADRSSEARARAVGQGETTAAAEDALELALRWIAEHQHADGGWSFRLDDQLGPCKGQCQNERDNPDDAPIPRTAATGLAMLAFMGAGSTHQNGPYAEQVRRGLYYLQSQARETSLGTDLQNGSMYGHGIATLALAELFVLSGDEELREFVSGVTFFASGAQHPSGGWGYLPAGPPDITLTAWHVVALKTAEQRGIRIPTTVIPQAKSYVATLANPLGNRFGYRSPEPKLSTTAMGVLLQLYFGYLPGQTAIREALDYIAAEGPSPTNVYYNYYAMLALHHARHAERNRFATNLRDHLIQTQAKVGHELGSWNFKDRYGSVGGRLYTTAMCALILETPYRYEPLYDPNLPFEL